MKGPTVLVIEDERHLADLYAEYLDDSYAVRTAYSGEEGLEMVTEDVDVVIVDHRMPVTSGSEVVAAIETSDVDCRIAMVTSEDPDFDIIDIGVDDYLIKPVTESSIREVVERMLAVGEYTRVLRELTRKKITRNVLRIEKSPSKLEESERYRELESEISRLQETLDGLAGRMEIEEQNLRL